MIPRATYRLQFRGGMTFDRAAALAPYWRELGISHLYASPIFAAEPGSSHGYDVVDFNRLDDELGGEAAFLRLSRALQAEGLGLILDFVPNHMAAAPANPWWRDVLAYGRQSRYARHFDIDWSAERLLLPVLGQPCGETLERGELALALDPSTGDVCFKYFELALPLSEASHRLLRERLDAVDAAAAAAIGNAEAFAAPEAAPAVERALAALSADRAFLHRLHDAQIWRLAHWRAARDSLTYRRFFEISGLVGVRVEEAEVFDDVHRLLLRLIAEGHVDGIRVDHIDGLAAPGAYLERLRRAAGDGTYIVVEKILEAEEALPADWPVAGTSGYEFITVLSRLLTTDRHIDALDSAYRDFTGAGADYETLAQEAKRQILTHNLAAELTVLTRAAAALAAEDPVARDFGADTLREAIVALVCAMPVYRSYVEGGNVPAADRRMLAAAAERAKEAWRVEDPAAVDFIASLATLARPDGQHQAAWRFASRFQQTTGPVMAKAVEDTLFYRYNRLIAVNEVGGDPRLLGGTAEAVHALLAERRRTMPHALSATATHDTKRGEDARARLYALSAAPEAWARAVRRWSTMNAGHKRRLAGETVPEAETEWLIYQALLGAWPPTLQAGDANGLAAFAERFLAYVVKALREAKRRTRWTAPATDYEGAVRDFAAGLLAPESTRFHTDFATTCRPFLRAGMIGGLVQTVLKLTAPGVPDIYQGSEDWDFSLVDPDNRRPVDFDHRRSLLEELGGLLGDNAPGAPALRRLLEAWPDGGIKLLVLARLLALRRRHAGLLQTGGYVPLAVSGVQAEQIFAFYRTAGTEALIVAVPRLPLLLAGDEQWLRFGEAWSDTGVVCPPGFTAAEWRQVLSGAGLKPKERAGEAVLAARDLFADLPVAALYADRAEGAAGAAA